MANYSICGIDCDSCRFKTEQKTRQTFKNLSGLFLLSAYPILLIRRGDLWSPAGERSSPLPHIGKYFVISPLILHALWFAFFVDKDGYNGISRDKVFVSDIAVHK